MFWECEFEWGIEGRECAAFSSRVVCAGFCMEIEGGINSTRN